MRHGTPQYGDETEQSNPNDSNHATDMATPEPDAVALVDLVGVEIRYPSSAAGAPPAVRNVNLTIRAGEKMVILGPSGSGKSTVLKAIAGFLTPAKGTILVDGAPVGRPSPRRMMVFQEFDQLLPWRTVVGNIKHALRTTKPDRGSGSTESREESAKNYLALVGLMNAAKRYPYQLSGGMKQRVAIARAFAVEPTLLLMDEPFGALDAQTRRRLQGELIAIHARTLKTIIFVTHSIDEALIIGDRIAVMSEGPGHFRSVITNTQPGIPDPRLVVELRQLLDGEEGSGTR